MVGAVHQSGFESNDRIASQNAVFDAVLQAFFNCREEGFWNGAAEYLLFKDQVVADGWLKLDPNIAELTVTARLFLMFALYFHFLADGFAVSNPWNLQGNRHAEFIFELGNQNVQMLFTQTGDQLLVGFCVVFISEGWVLFHQSLQSGSNLGFIALCLGFDCHGQARMREVDWVKAEHLFRVAQRVAGFGSG